MEELDDLVEAIGLLDNLDHLRNIRKLQFYKPYPYQVEFHNAKGKGSNDPAKQRLLLAANKIGKCVSVRTKITHVDGTETTAGELYERNQPFTVMSWDGEKLVPAFAQSRIKKPAEPIYRFTLASGEWFECAQNHRFLTNQGWRFASEAYTCWHSLPASNWVRALLVRVVSGLRLFEKQLDSLACCLIDFRLCDAQLQTWPNIDLDAFPSRGDVLKHTLPLLHWDGLGNRYTSNPYTVSAPRASSYAPRRFEAQLFATLVHAFGKTALWLSERTRAIRQLSTAVAFRPQSTDERYQRQDEDVLALLSPNNEDNRIVSCDLVGVEEIYDFWVPNYGNYLAGGVIHHNTYCAAMEIAIHATGRYPDWWKGTRFARAPEIIVCGVTNDSVRDIGQMELCGDPTDKTKLGTGSLPKDSIVKCTPKNGVVNAYDAILVRHASGQNSRIYFRAYEQGWKKFQGIAFEICWPDEEPPPEIWSQLIRAGLAKKGSMILCTMTPEEGMTELVRQFMEDLRPGQAMTTATWWDVTHITDIEQRLASLRPHERDMRSKGIPLRGAGLIYPISDDDLIVDPIEIPRHWPQIIGIDFGISTEHPFSAIRWAHDRDSDTKYIISEYKTTNDEASVHVDAIKKWGDWIPVAWPHDGSNREKGSGIQLQATYRSKGLTNLLPWKASNPPDGSTGQQEGDGGNSLEKSVLSMLDDMYLGKIKVFSTCQEWFKEKRMYHRDLNAKIVAQWNDVLDASRYGHMMLRHARTMSVLPKKRTSDNVGMRNW